MNRIDLVDEVSRVIEAPRAQSAVVVETVFERITECLRGGGTLEIRRFGTFRMHRRRARIGRNPSTGDAVQVTEKRIAYFKPSKEVREIVNS